MGDLRERCNSAVKVDVVPEDFMTTRQWAEQEECSLCTAQRMLNHLMSTGQVESQDFRVKVSRRRALLVPHYRIIPVSQNAKKGRAK